MKGAHKNLMLYGSPTRAKKPIVVLYKFGDALVSIVANPFYIEMGFSKIEIANVSKIFGPAATLAGAFIGGIIVTQSGIFKSLLLCGILQMLSNLFYAIQAYIGYNIGFLIVTIGFMDLASGMGTAAFIAGEIKPPCVIPFALNAPHLPASAVM